MPALASRAARLVVSASLLVGLSACAEQPRPSAPPSIPPEDALATTSTAPNTTPASSKGTAKPSSSGGAEEYERDADGYPVMPAAAKENTKAGAEAFARWYLELINATSAKPKRGVVAGYALPGCKSCANHEDANARHVSDRQHFDSPYWVIGKTRIILPEPEGRWNVGVVVTQRPARLVDTKGATVEALPSERVVLHVHLMWADSNWAVSEIRVAPAEVG